MLMLGDFNVATHAYPGTIHDRTTAALSMPTDDDRTQRAFKTCFREKESERLVSRARIDPVEPGRFWLSWGAQQAD